MIEDDFSGLSPINFFQITHNCYYHPGNSIEKNSPLYLLPSTSALYKKKSFADLYVAWNEGGILFHAIVKEPLLESSYPDITSGDSIEVFIDTRDVKTSGYNTRFCHHFFFLPEPVSGHSAGEVTKFRAEESHPYCDPDLLQIKTVRNKQGYNTFFFIPAECLFGYDSNQFNKIGFSYRINRKAKESQYFSAIDQEFKIEEQPSLWSSLELVRK